VVGRGPLFGGRDGPIADKAEGGCIGGSGSWREARTSGRKGHADEKPSLTGREAGEAERHEDKDQECRQLGNDQRRREGREKAAFKQEFGHKTSCVGGRRRERQSMVAPPSMLNVLARRCPKKTHCLATRPANRTMQTSGTKDARSRRLLQKLRCWRCAGSIVEGPMWPAAPRAIRPVPRAPHSR